jgi:hypothetical protein
VLENGYYIMVSGKEEEEEEDRMNAEKRNIKYRLSNNKCKGYINSVILYSNHLNF